MREVDLRRDRAVDLLRYQRGQGLDVQARRTELVGGDQLILRLGHHQVRLEFREALHVGEGGDHQVVGGLQRGGIGGADVNLHLAAARVGAVLRLPHTQLGGTLISLQRALDPLECGVVLPVLDEYQDRSLGRIRRHSPRGREGIALSSDGCLIGGDPRNSGDQCLDLLRLRVGLSKRRVVWHRDAYREGRAR